MNAASRTALSTFAALLVSIPLGSLGAQSTTATQGQAPAQKTVEESYLQSSLETMVIREQAHADGRDMKMVALQYARQAMDAGRKNDDIRDSLEYLALETSTVVIRSGGGGRVLNDYPDIRAKACDYLGEFPSEQSKDALVKVVLADREPMVLAAAIRSLGKIGMNDGNEVSQDIAYTLNRYDVLLPDNSLAFESLVALERINDKTGGLKDQLAIQVVMRIATGNYIAPVKQKAAELLDKLRKASLSGGS